MSDSLQLQILKALTTHLEGVTGIPLLGGGTADLTGKVFRGRTLFSNAEAGPLLSILEARKPDDAKSPITGEDYMTYDEQWHLLIQGFMPDDPANPTDLLYNFKALVEQRLGLLILRNVTPLGLPANPSVFRLGGLITDLRFAPGVVRAASQTAGQVESFYLPVVLSFAINLTDPFNPVQQGTYR